MHFVTGGSFNGKLNWVLNEYNLDIHQDHINIIRCYQGGSISNFGMGDYFVLISELEFYLNSLKKNDSGRAAFNQQLKIWLQWEAELENRKLILIGSDISKGVVPIDKKDREWRDFVGWCYQDIVSSADRVDVIWYGISNTIKS